MSAAAGCRPYIARPPFPVKRPAVIAIDQGTTGTTCLVVDEAGAVRSRAYSEFSQCFPLPGWVEHDPEEIWRTTCKVARTALEGAQDLDVRSVGITNQRETIVMWERDTLTPIGPAIVWQDRRTADHCARLRRGGYEADVRARTGLVIDPYFSATKVAWMLDESGDPTLRRRAEAGGELAAGTIDSWLVARLTDGAIHATDPTNASRTMLFNLAEARWDPWLADLLGVPTALLPEIRPSAVAPIAGFAKGRPSGISAERSAALAGPHGSGNGTPGFGIASGVHLGIEVPIGGVAGDQQAALFGQGCVSPGLAKNTYGTGAFLLLHSGDVPPTPPDGLLATAACGPTGDLAYALEGSVLVAGAAIQWLRDGIGIIDRASDSAPVAASLPDNGGVHFVPAFAGLGAPHWEPEARGTLVGLSRGTTRAHVVRAALESMAHRTADVLEAMAEALDRGASELRVDGGASANDWLMQFQADLLGIIVRRPSNVETTALGAAGLAGVSVGLWSEASDFVAATDESSGAHKTFTPALGREERTAQRKGWSRAVSAALAWARER